MTFKFEDISEALTAHQMMLAFRKSHWDLKKIIIGDTLEYFYFLTNNWHGEQLWVSY